MAEGRRELGDFFLDCYLGDSVGLSKCVASKVIDKHLFSWCCHKYLLAPESDLSDFLWIFVLFVIRLSGSSLERSSLLQQLISSWSVCQEGPSEGSCLDRAVSASWDQFVNSIPKLYLLGLCGPSHASFQILLPFWSVPPLGMYTNCY